MTIAIKTHGHTTDKGVGEPDREKQKAYNHFDEVGSKAILLVRNPFRAIIGHRH